MREPEFGEVGDDEEVDVCGADGWDWDDLTGVSSAVTFESRAEMVIVCWASNKHGIPSAECRQPLE
jgi:hypothetical protein